MPDIYSPHDKFFRETWSRKEVVKSFLENQIPKVISRCLNIESLHLENASFIDTELKAHFSDMLYSLETKDHQPILQRSIKLTHPFSKNLTHHQ